MTPVVDYSTVIDRVSRSLQHLVEMMNDLNSKNVDLYFHQQPLDTSLHCPYGILTSNWTMTKML